MRLTILVLLFVFRYHISHGQLSTASLPDSLRVIEKVYLHTDRDIYFPGDDIWFKAYLIDASTRLLSDHSNNLHVELIAPDSKIIDSRIVRLSGGLGNGDFKLGEKLVSGRYSLRAYTNFMRNFSDELFFSKDINIIIPTDSAKGEPVENKLEISFFPEGGSLVDNVNSTIGFKAVNALGEGCDVTGDLYSSGGEKLTSFKSAHKGLGSFSLNPLPGESYFVVIRDSYGHTLNSNIPKSFPVGVTLSVTNNKSGELEMIIKTNKETLPTLLGHDLTLTVFARGKVLKTLTIQLKSVSSHFTLPIDDLPDGIVALTMSDATGKPQCERLVYIQNNENVKINIETDKPEYQQRDSVTLAITISGNYALAPEAYLSLSATESDPTDKSYSTTISSWFLLESDVRGEVEDPSYYFDSSNPDRFKHLDLLLLTQGWRDFKWKYNEVKFPPEYGFTISGRVRKKFANIPVKNAIINFGLFTKGKPIIGQIPTDSTGRFYIKEVDLTDTARLIASITGDNGKMQGWLLIDSIKYAPEKVIGMKVQKKYLPDVEVVQTSSKEIKKFIQYAEYKTSLNKKYRLSDTIMPGEITITARRIDAPGSPRARSINALGTQQIDHEYVVDQKMDAHYTNVGNLIKTKWVSPVSRLKSPYYMIDGNFASEADVSSIPIDWVERVDVIDDINKLMYRRPGETSMDEMSRYLKSLVKTDKETAPIIDQFKRSQNYADGAISIILKPFKDVYFPAYHSVNTRITGYNEPRIFYSPSHHTTLEKDYKPDLRTTLFWEPYLNLANNNKAVLGYFNADDPAVITIIAEGMTTTGIPVTGKAQYEVK